MADEKRSVLGVIAGVIALLTALVGLFAAIQHEHVSSPEPSTPRNETVQPQPRPPNPISPEKAHSDDLRESKVPDLSGSWTMTGALQNGTPFSGQTYLQQDGRFVSTVNGVTSAAGVWNVDAGSRTLRLEGRHALYGTTADFTCTLAGDPSSNAFRGTCTDYAGTGTLRLVH
jgi:hypothetical protein